MVAVELHTHLRESCRGGGTVPEPQAYLRGRAVLSRGPSPLKTIYLLFMDQNAQPRYLGDNVTGEATLGTQT